MYDLEFKNVSVAGIKSDDNNGIIDAIVSVTGIVDNVNDIIEPGAYEKTLAVRTPKGVWHHSWTDPVAKTLDVKELMPGDPRLPKELPNGQPWPEEAGAVLVKMQFNLDAPRGKQAYSDVKFFAEQQEWSIGYNVPQGGAMVEQKSGRRRIKTLDWYEYSPVLFGAMPNARTQGGVKDAQLAFKSMNANQFEHKADGDAEVANDVPDEINPDDQQLIDDLSDSIDPDDLFEDEDEDTEDEEKSYFYPEERKSVDPKKLRVAIKALEDVLSDMEEDEEPDEDATDEEKGMPVAFQELKAIEYTSMMTAVQDHDLGGGLLSAAKAFDTALAGKDVDAAVEAAGDLLDRLEELSDEDEEGEKSDVIAIVGSALQQMVDSLDASESKSLETPLRTRRQKFLEGLSDEDLNGLHSYVSTTRGNSGIKAVLDEEMATRAVLTGKPYGPALQRKTMKPKPKPRKFTQKQRDNAAEEGNAREDGSFPIVDEDSLKRAIKAHGRAKDPEAAKAHIKKRAKEMDKEDMLPDDWQEKAIIALEEFEAAGIDVKSFL